jgi:hypothetical protein
MSLFDDEMILIPLYYMYGKTAYGQQLMILSKEDAEKMLEDPVEKDQVQILNTKWKQLTWKEDNDLMKRAERNNPSTGEPDLDWANYQDQRVKTCLKWWDYKNNPEDPEPIPVTHELIDKMQSLVVRSLLQKFDAALTVEPARLEK